MTLQEIREEIDQIDQQMKALFVRRMGCAEQVAETKAKSGGDVFVPEREAEIIKKRTADLRGELQSYNQAFLKYTMCVSRRSQYAILKKMQEDVIADLLHRAGLQEAEEHSKVRVSFDCWSEDNSFNMYMNMTALNGIPIQELSVTERDGRQKVTMTLKGNLKDSSMRILLCQLGKEASDFKILSLEK